MSGLGKDENNRIHGVIVERGMEGLQRRPITNGPYVLVRYWRLIFPDVKSS
jgi:hypothetical protein